MSRVTRRRPRLHSGEAKLVMVLGLSLIAAAGILGYIGAVPTLEAVLVLAVGAACAWVAEQWL